MVSYKLDKIDRVFIAFVCVVVCLFNIGTFVFASEEEVTLSSVNNLTINPSNNYFSASESVNVYYFSCESGYIYTIKNNKSGSAINIASSNSIPTLNGTYTFLIKIQPGESYGYIGSGENIYLSTSSTNSNGISVVREKAEGQSSAINDLIDNVGINQIWGVFEGGIDFVGVVVLVAFGVFLLALAIKRISKGKSDF